MNQNNWPSRRNFLAALCLAGASQALAKEPQIHVPDYNRMTDEEEIALGRQAAADIEKEERLTFVEASGVREYVDKMFRKIVETSRRPNLPYSIRIVDTKEINAFALPGGFVYLDRGLIEWARSESELAAALCHEVGHVVGHHSANAFARASGADSLLSEASKVLLGDDTPARIIQQIGGPLETLALLKYGRTQELEADLLGFYSMQRAGWDPQGMLELFRHFGENATLLDPLFTLTSDHPLDADRERQIADEMRQFPPRKGLLHDTDEFRRMQAELKRLPPAPAQDRLFGH